MPPGMRDDARFCSDRCRYASRSPGKLPPVPRGQFTIPSQPTVAQLAYLAGIIDGEGHFETPVGQCGGIVCCMADVPVLEWCHEHFSGSLSNAYVPPGNSRPRKMWHLRRQVDLIYVLPRLQPFLVLKSEECRLMTELVQLHLDRPKGPLTPEFAAQRDVLRLAIRTAIRARK